MHPVFIYTLNCPLTRIVRYCGQTKNPDLRLTTHIRDARKKKWHVSRWINKLLSKNLRPVMEILDVIPDTESDFWEREYIQNFRERGFDLTNGTDGGDGGATMKGKKLTPEHRASIGNAQRGRKLSPERCAKMSAAMKGKFSGKQNPFFGKKHTPESCAKISAVRKDCVPWSKGKKFSSEHCAKISASKIGKIPWNKNVPGPSGENHPFFGKKHAPETKAKMSATKQQKRNEKILWQTNLLSLLRVHSR